MKTIFIITVLFFSTHSLWAQDSIQICGQLKGNTKFSKVVVQKFAIGTFDIIAVPIKEEKFTINLPSKIESGVYRMQYSQTDFNSHVDIIVTGKEKNIEFVLDISQKDQLPIFSKSLENKTWYDYQYNSKKQIHKVALLSDFLGNYPDKKDRIFSLTQKAYKCEKKIYNNNLKAFVNKNKGNWAEELVSNTPINFQNPLEEPILQDYNYRNTFWNEIITTNPKLINTPLYTGHILNYLKYYMNPEMHFDEAEMENGLKKSVDTIMQKFSGNAETKKFALKYLQLGFKEIGQEKVLQYIDENYKEVIQQCQDENENNELQKRLAGYEAIAVGKKAPEISFFDKSGKITSLKELPQDKVIVVFWASWCPNCEQQMPKLQNFISTNSNIGAVAISLDDNPESYEAAIKKYPDIYHTCDFLKWKGKSASDYYIYATPTFILLDKERKIIDKFSTIEAVIQYSHDAKHE